MPDIDDFIGYYYYKNIEIPVFKTFSDIGKKFFIFDKLKFGKIMQYNPLDKDESEELKESIFYINIRSYSKHINLLEAILKEPPDWLKEIGDKSKQNEFLLDKVLVHIFERFEIKLSDDFWCYRVDL